MKTDKDAIQLTEAYNQVLENKIAHVSKDTQLTKWVNDPNFQKFLRHVQTDIFVGLKYGETEENVRKVLEAFAKQFVNYAIPTMAEPKSMFPKKDIENKV